MQKSPAALIASWPEDKRAAFLDGLSENALGAMPWLWEIWAHPLHQKPPEGNWKTWVILGGRGAGKTRAGAEWIRAQIEGATPLGPGRCRRIALIGATLEEARAIMVEGESGLLAITPPDRRPEMQISQRRLVWPNGAQAQWFSAARPESLRGPQFDGAWADELAKWPLARDTWDQLQFALRLGDNPRRVITTTPRDNPVLAEILEDPATVACRAATHANRAHLAPGFVDQLEARFGGTHLGRQELMGEMVRERAGALWTREMIEQARVSKCPELDRVVVAVDPAVTSHKNSDLCGIVVAGVQQKGDPSDWQAYVLADLSVAGKRPGDWAAIAVDAYEQFCADRLVAEVNQGGEMVETTIRQSAPQIAFRPKHASRGKRARAEPVSALYEQSRVHHVGAFPEMEDQMCSFVASRTRGRGSPDRLDALVWALSDLMIDPIRTQAPRIRNL